MGITRRLFLKTSAGAGATVAGARFFKGAEASAALAASFKRGSRK
jgi:anaerobic selenocysteine-containing dehydrogenase